MDVLKRMLISAGLFGFLGPPVGALLITVFGVVSILSDGRADAGHIGTFAGLTMIAVLLSYPMALAPALVTGLICGVFERSVRRDWLWVAASAAVGAVVTAVYYSLVGGSGLLMIGAGTLAAAVCGWARRTARWPHRSPRSKVAAST